MNYSDDPSMVRVDIFKESGKWYTTIAMKWQEYDSSKLITEIFRNSLEKVLGDSCQGMIAVCLDPYHKHPYPLMIRIGQWDE